MMISENNVKSILFLGGSAAMCDAVEHAQALGYRTIVVDYYIDSPAKRIADKQYLASTTDIDALMEIAIQEGINGVFTGFADVNLLPARILADKLSLPFYANKHQIEITTNKLLFKQVCRDFDIPTVPEFYIDDKLSKDDLSLINYPVIVKPADSYSSKGVSVCVNRAELLKAVPFALEYSRVKRVIVEQYLVGYPDVCMYFNIQNGVLSLAAMCERDMNYVKVGKAMQPNALFYPCRYIPLYYEQLEDKLKRMIQRLDMRQGLMFIQCFVVDGVLMPFEMGYRLCGAQEYILCAAENGINSLDMLLDYSVTGRFEGWDVALFNKPMFKHTYAILLVLLKPGCIARIDGMDSILNMPEVLKVVQFYNTGDEVKSDSVGTLNQTLARIFVQGKDSHQLLQLIEIIQNHLKVISDKGDDMILPGYDCGKANVLRDM